MTFWTVFLQKDLVEKFITFKKLLKQYEKKKAEELLDKVQDSAIDRNEDSLEMIIEYSEEWILETEAINKLLNNEKQIFKIGKYIIILLFIVYVSGIYSSMLPNEIIIGDFSKIDLAQIFFVIEIILILYWFWRIFNFS
ncbi:MAG: hypothetical protein K8R25_08130 [Methanosarcinales archaeon]|nr:hypothetical protein [Methanosarcinales archaeon]